MKLLIYISSLSSGGAERVASSLANNWTEMGWQVSLITLANLQEDFYHLNPKVERITLNLSGESSQIFAAIFNNIKRILALRRELRKVRPDVALSMISSCNIHLALASVGMNCMVTVGSERIHPPQMPLGLIWEALRYFFYGWLDAIVALTDESAIWLYKFTRAIRVVVIPNPVNHPLLEQSPWVPPPIKDNKHLLLLAVGRLSYQKGFIELIDSFNCLAKSFPKWRLAILGEGPLRSVLLDKIDTASLGSRILLPGRVGNLGDWYLAADLFVLSSHFEGFPNSLVEAMSYGLPVIALDCDTGPRDIIRHNIDGLLVPMGDGEALVDSIRSLMKDECLRYQFGHRAIDIRERFSMPKISDKWKELFDSLILEKTKTK